jgi:hypothetical protein
MPAESTNPKGCWEDLDICELNCSMLHVSGADWHHLAFVDIDDMETEQENYFLSKAAKLLRLKFIEVSIFGFKDPRTIKLFPFWKKVFRYCQLDVSCVLAIRHPLSVSQSLSKRDGFDTEKNYLLWLGHIIESLSGSHGLKRVLVDYDKLMFSPEFELNRVAEKLDLKINEIELEFYKSQFLNTALRHTTYSLDDLSRDAHCPPLVREVYAALLEVASGKAHLEDPTMQNQIVSWKKEYERLKPSLILIDKALGRIASQVAGRDEQLANLSKVLVEREENIAKFKSQIEDIYASTSWRLTRPIRAAKILISPRVVCERSAREEN